MMITNLDVLDTAVKVGLGALLGGYFTFATQAYIQKQTNERERAKELRDRLYAITIRIGKSFEDITHYLSCAYAFNQNPSSETAKNEFHASDQNFTASFKGLLSVPHELEVLGLSKSSKAAKEYFLTFSFGGEMAQEAIIGADNRLRNAMHDAFDKCMDTFKSDYHDLFPK